ncbi:MAG TPA: HisA/HisF-related TIM barrel protein, partial [Candidatus Thermoplasmatota archaeon]|nr:HisA/HisF-related TIM barrel protein [Candidatus Thermoplasmatota archaeon]
TGTRPNDDALLSILDSVHVPVQMGGGVKSLKRIQELRDTGVQRVLVGSMGVLHPDWMKEAAKVFPEGVVASLDEKAGNVWVKGRTEDTGKRLVDVAKEFDGFGFEAMLISSLDGTSHDQLRSWAEGLDTPVMLAPRVEGLDELGAFKDAGIQGVVLETEVYDGTIDVAAATKFFKAS